jgi:hypothetical protein
MQGEKKLFAFKLAETRDETRATQGQWKARDGLSVAGCTELQDGSQEWRERSIGQGGVGVDAWYFC